ncbi:MAG: hypothetical protein ACXVBW_05280 [Bdellovibrionota bacterium]
MKTSKMIVIVVGVLGMLAAPAFAGDIKTGQHADPNKLCAGVNARTAETPQDTPATEPAAVDKGKGSTATDTEKTSVQKVNKKPKEK